MKILKSINIWLSLPWDQEEAEGEDEEDGLTEPVVQHVCERPGHCQGPRTARSIYTSPLPGGYTPHPPLSVRDTRLIQTYTDLYSLIQENNHSKFTKGSIMSFLFTWAEIMSWKDNWGEKERERVRKWFVSFIVINHQDQECVEWIYLWGNWINFVPFVLYKDSYSFQNIFIHLQFLHFYKT